MGTADTPITVVFILSANRSGSTWLNLVLGSCSWAASLGEHHRYWTMPEQAACRLCEADGLADCVVFGGMRHVPREQAYRFPAQRTGRRILADASKDAGWCRDFLDRPDIDARIVHVVRHPCGQVESQLRRDPGLTPDAALEHWAQDNAALEAFIESAPAPSRIACYDELADAPDSAFPPLCRWLGHDWEPAAIEYWRVPHHAVGANGASSVYLRGRKFRNYVTGEDAYYEQITRRPVAADRRWRERLPREFRARASRHPYVEHLRARLPGVWKEW